MIRSIFLVLSFIVFIGDFSIVLCDGAVQESKPDSSQEKPSENKPFPQETVKEPSTKSRDEVLIYSTDFDDENSEWSFTDPRSWKKDSKEPKQNGGGEKFPILSLFQKQSEYKPKVRSPFHQAILNEPVVESFQLDVEVLSTHKPYGHRDVCLFFGYENESRFYYVHLGQKTDPHCNQIFLVNDADRKKISATTTDGTSWSDRWHKVRIIRDVDSGAIEVFFDDMKTPAMTANDKTFPGGKVGVGSFDDTADFRFFRLRKLVPVDDSAGVRK